MEVKRLAQQLSVSPQIMPADVAALEIAGFRSIICNRPDGEAADQPSAREVEAAAVANGLAFSYLPVVSGRMSDNDAEQFGSLLQTMSKPVLAYCRTGTRSTSL